MNDQDGNDNVKIKKITLKVSKDYVIPAVIKNMTIYETETMFDVIEKMLSMSRNMLERIDNTQEKCGNDDNDGDGDGDGDGDDSGSGYNALSTDIKLDVGDISYKDNRYISVTSRLLSNIKK